MKKREIAVTLINQDELEYEFEFRFNGNWYKVIYSNKVGFKGNYPENDDIDYILLDCKEEDVKNIYIK